MNSRVTGIILAGGESKRMGTDKAFVRLNGKPLISYALNTLKTVSSEILLSVGSAPLQYETTMSF